MSQTILSILGTSTPISEQIAKELGLIKAAIVCRVFFYQQLKDGVCRASNKSFQDSLGLSAGAVSSNLKWLLEDGWIINVKPLVKGNRPNHYKVTQKFYGLLERSPDESQRSPDESDIHQMNGKEESKEESKEKITSPDDFGQFNRHPDYKQLVNFYQKQVLQSVTISSVIASDLDDILSGKTSKLDHQPIPLDLVLDACKEMIRANKRDIRYLVGILSNWQKNGGKPKKNGKGHDSDVADYTQDKQYRFFAELDND